MKTRAYPYHQLRPFDKRKYEIGKCPFEVVIVTARVRLDTESDNENAASENLLASPRGNVACKLQPHFSSSKPEVLS